MILITFINNMFIMGPAIVGLPVLIKYVLHGSESDFGFAKGCMASGGGARGTLLQFIADLLIIQVEHSAIKDCTVYNIYKLLNPDCDQTSFKSLLVNFV